MIRDREDINIEDKEASELEEQNAKNLFKSIAGIFALMEKRHKKSFFWLCVLAFFTGLTVLVPAQVISVLINKIIGDPMLFFGISIPSTLPTLTVVLIGGLIALAAFLFSGFLSNYIWRYAEDVKLSIKQKAYGWIITPRKNLDIGMTQGDATYRINSSTDEIGDILIDGINMFMPGIFTAILSFIYIGIMDPISLPVLIAGTIAIILLVKVRSHFERPLSVINEKEKSRLNNYIVNALSNLPIINIFCSQRHEQQIFYNKCEEYRGHWNQRTKIWRWYWVVMDIIQIGCIYGIIALLAKRATSGAISAASIVIIASYVTNAFNPLQNFGWFFGRVIMAGVKVDRIFKMKPTEDSVIDTTKDIPIKERITKIEMKHVFVNNGIDVHIDDVNLILEKGKLIVFTGPSGGGKTTTIRTLIGLTERNKGDIIINDKYQVHTLFSYVDRFSVVMQSPYIFNRDPKDNILYPNIEQNKKNSELIDFLSMDEVAKRKYDEDCEQNLENMLSGGEKKRIAVLRGLIPDKEMYIFDEPTNELDAKNTKKVLELINDLKEHAIVVVVTHDKRMISQADQLIEISNKYESGARLIPQEEITRY